MELSSSLGIRALSRKENLSFFGVLSHIINPSLTKVVRSRWLDIGLAHVFLRVYGPRLRLGPYTRKKELGQYAANLAHAWPITHFVVLDVELLLVFAATCCSSSKLKQVLPF